MHIGMVTDSLAQLSTDEVLHTAAELGLKSVEFCCGNWSAAPHLNLQQLLSNTKAREDFHAKVRDHGLTISALNASGNPCILEKAARNIMPAWKARWNWLASLAWNAW